MIVTNHKRRKILIGDKFIEPNQSIVLSDKEWFDFANDKANSDDILQRKITAERDK
jgi:hypothetical protein